MPMSEIDEEVELIDGDSDWRFPWEASETTLAEPLPLSGFGLKPLSDGLGTMTLRPYQNEAVDAIYAAWQEHQSVLAVLATGLGKTVIAADVIIRWPGPGRILFIAHVRELIGQAKRKIHQHTKDMPEVEMGIASALNRNLIDRSKVVVASIQTMKNRKEKFNPADFDLLMIDEAHHSGASTYRELVQWLIDGNPHAKILGITATPDRADGISLGSVFDHCAYEMSILTGIEQGYLVPIKQRYFAVDGLDFSKCRTTKKSGESDFREDDLTSAMLGGKETEDMSAEEKQQLIEKQEAMLHRVVAPTVREAAGRPGIVYCVTVEHATRMAEVFRRYPGVTAEVIHAKTEEKDRDDLLARFKAGNLQFLVNVAIAVEGFDAPAAQIIVNARPTKSRAFYTQAIGRGTRAIDGLVDQFDTAEERREAIAGSAKPCIASGQRVLTDVGLVPIEKVTKAMKVWDGIDFVSHCGIIFRGVKRVITYAGLTATPDHEVFTNDETSKQDASEMRTPFRKCAAEQIPIKVTGIGQTAIRATENYFSQDCPSERQTAHSDAMYCLPEEEIEGSSQCCKRKGRVPIMQPSATGTGMASQEDGVGKATMHESERYALCQLWGKGHRVSIPVANRRGDMGPRQSRTHAEMLTRPHRQQRTLRTGQSAVGYTDAASLQSTNSETASGNYDPCVQTGSSGNSVFGRNSQNSVFPSFHNQPDCGAIPEIREQEAPVWDILNAGPRHRFTVEGLLVSNCMEVFDFVGNSGKHKLVSTADVLAGDIPEPFVRAAQKEAEHSGEAADIRAKAWEKKKEHDAEVERRRIEEAEELAKEEARRLEARKKEEERRSKIRAEAEYRTKDVNPFDVHARAADQRQQEFKGGASEKQYRFIELLGMLVRNAPLTTKQAGRIINQLQKGTPLEEVAYKNGIKDWEPKGPTFKQVMALKGIPHEWVKSGADASALISAKKNVPEFESRMLEDIHNAGTPERLTQIGKILVNVNKSINLPMSTYGRIVAAGKAKRSGATQEAPADDF